VTACHTAALSRGNRVHRYILMSEAIAYLTDGWDVKPFGGHRVGYAMASRPYEPEN